MNVQGIKKTIGTSVVTVDSPDFHKLVAAINLSNLTGSGSYMSKAWLNLIAHLDTRTADAVAQTAAKYDAEILALFDRQRKDGNTIAALKEQIAAAPKQHAQAALSDVDEPSEIEAVIACLGDDAARLQEAEPEVADNMRAAERLLEALATRQPAPEWQSIPGGLERLVLPDAAPVAAATPQGDALSQTADTVDIDIKFHSAWLRMFGEHLGGAQYTYTNRDCWKDGYQQGRAAGIEEAAKLVEPMYQAVADIIRALNK